MKKHIGETRETVKPSQHQTVAIALTALYRLHSFISHRFYSILHPSFITTKNATFLPIWPFSPSFLAISCRTTEQNATPTTLNATVREHNIVRKGTAFQKNTLRPTYLSFSPMKWAFLRFLASPE